jgi:multidrug efflux pump subunit AcrB
MTDTRSLDTRSGVISWFARNHVAANLLMIVIIIGGLVAAFTIRTQVNPDIESNSITINVPYPGASPGEVETGVVARIEEAVRDIDGIEEMRSVSRQSIGIVTLEIENRYDLQAVMDDVKLAVDRIVSMPGDAERPIISRSLIEKGAINVQVYGDLDERGLKALAQEIREEILNLPSVTKAELAGARAYEISIDIDEDSLRQYGLTLAQVARAIQATSVDIGAGSIRTESGDILLRTQGQAYQQAEFERIVLIKRSDGTRLTLGDVAQVRDGFVEQDFYSLFNGQPSVGVTVSAVADQNQIEISRQVRDYVEQRKSRLPPGIHLDYWLDSTEYLNATLNMMLSNMAFGALLVLLMLGLFLRIQLAFWVMLGIPVAFLGALALLPGIGGSINMISLFGFILVLGIVVDDAIVIGESVQTSLERDGHSVDTVIRGARRVAVPATFGVLTTIATFTPLLFVPGNFGAVPASIGWVVILCLVFSLVESKLILPSHLASMRELPPLQDANRFSIRVFQQRFSDAMRRWVKNYYQPALQRAVEHRYTTTAIFLGSLILALGFTLGPYVRTVMFPDLSADFAMAQIELVEGSSSAQTVRVVSTVADALLELNEALPEDEQFLQNMIAFTFGANGQIVADLRTHENVDPTAVARLWRESVGEIVGTRKLEISGAQRSHGGTGDLSFRLLGSNERELRGAAEQLQEILRQYQGVYGIENSGQGAIPELDIQITSSGEALGLSLRDLASQVRAAFYGVEAQRLQRGGEEVRVMVRYPESERRSMGNLESMFVRTADGDEVPFSAVAAVDRRLSPSAIVRIGGDRSIEVSADLDEDSAQAADIVSDILQGSFQQVLREEFPSVTMQLGGASEEEQELIVRLIYTGGLGLFAIYALMAIPLRSYVQPLIIMGVIPFGMIGALIGHLLVGIPFSALSLFGLVALAGVVVNDSIIMVDFINKSVESGTPVEQAVVNAGTERFRAIVLTSLTTFFGLIPILLESSLSAQIVTPMAVSLGFGIVFATLITLVLIPSLYVILDDLKSGAGRLRMIGDHV